MPQILHVDECNGAATALRLPLRSSPYKGKFTLCFERKGIRRSENTGFFVLGGGKVKLRLEGVSTVRLGANEMDPKIEQFINAVIWDYSYLL